MQTENKFYGIDLGTTYSCIAGIDEYDKPVVFKDLVDDTSTTPSVVYYNDANDVTVGAAAKESLGVDPHKTVALIKREMGNPNFQSQCEFPESPTEVSARILKKMVSIANDQLGENIKDVVITCPAYFGTEERMQTKQAGIIAGLNVLEVINEPTAAALAYGSIQNNDKVILVYDLGGGTFDVTMIHVKPGAIDVVVTGGDARLGGADWDKELAKYFAKSFADETGLSGLYDELLDYIEGRTVSDLESVQRLLLQAENVKKKLSGVKVAKQSIQYGGATHQVEISREKFDEITSHLLAKTLELTDQMLNAAGEKGYSISKIDDIILVGGSSIMPQVKNAIEQKFCKEAMISDPHMCVAKGAAIRAKDLLSSGQNSTQASGQNSMQAARRIGNVLSKTYGTDVTDGVANLVFRNTTVPCKGEDTFYTQRDGQTAVKIFVYESETDEKTIDLGKAKPLAEDKILNFGKPVYAGTAIRVVFEVDSEGILAVVAYNDTERARLDFKLELNNVFSDDEMEQLVNKHSKSRMQ